MIARTAAIALALGAAGCATIVQGPDQRVVFETQPAGATVRAGAQACTTPCSMRLRRNRAVDAEIRKPGYAPELVPLRQDLDPWLAGNFAFLPFFMVGGAVDLISGAGFQLHPRTISVPLRPSGDPDGDDGWKPVPGGEEL